MKPFKGKGVPFQPWLRAGCAFGEFADSPAKAASLGGADEIFEGRFFCIPQRRVDDRTGKELAGAPNEEVVEPGGAGLFHPSRRQEIEQLVAIIAPSETGRIVEGLELHQVLRRKRQL